MNKFLLTLFLWLTLVNFAFAEIPIYCPHCKQHLYNYQRDEVVIGSQIKAEDFKPTRIDISQPLDSEPMICPFDGCPLNQYESFAWERKMKPPVFHIWAVSLLTKDKNGNWIGIPY